MPLCTSAGEAVRNIKSDQTVFVHGGAATPNRLLDALIENADLFNNVELIHLHTEGSARYASSRFAQNFHVTSLFSGENLRPQMKNINVDYLPCFLSEIPQLFLSKRRKIHAALLHLSPPDRHGYCTLGTNVDVALAAFLSADLIIAQINLQMPRIHGAGFIHINDVDHYIEVDEPLPETTKHESTAEEKKIAETVASMIENGACLQVGIGTIPNAILEMLTAHKNLGLHSEMWSDGVLNLIKSGVIDNSKKSVHPGRSVSAFVLGTKALYDFVNDNPSIIQLGADHVNNPNIIARNQKVVAINSAVEIDLTGQVCADSIGHKIISGVGGQMDFMRGAALSEGGKPIIVMMSRTKKNKSKIVFELKPGAGVVTTRSHVHYVVTEYGMADLAGKTLRERAQSLIAIAHPEDRDALKKQWRDNF